MTKSKNNNNRPQKPTCLVYDPVFLEHQTGMCHPEAPERLTAILSALEKAPWYGDLRIQPACPADVDVITLAHDPRYVESVQKESELGFNTLSTGDTAICPRSYEIAVQAVGGVLAATDLLMTGQVKNGFCAIRPPGHHATSTRGMGFCMFNNIAIAARYAQKKYNIERVLIADWDVHHGNGTQEIFYEDPTVFYMSSHQFPWYPMSGSTVEQGAGAGEGFNMNRPLPAGASEESIIKVYREDLLPAARHFKPDLTLISAGFDSHMDDPLGRLRISLNGFRELTRILLEIASYSSQGRLLSLLEGGYNLGSLAASVCVHVEELQKF